MPSATTAPSSAPTNAAARSYATPSKHEHVDEVAASRADRPRDAELAAALCREHHEDEEDQQDPGRDRERAEGREEGDERRPRIVRIRDRIPLQRPHLETELASPRARAGHDRVGRGRARDRPAAIRDEHCPTRPSRRNRSAALRQAGAARPHRPCRRRRSGRRRATRAGRAATGEQEDPTACPRRAADGRRFRFEIHLARDRGRRSVTSRPRARDRREPLSFAPARRRTGSRWARCERCAGACTATWSTIAPGRRRRPGPTRPRLGRPGAPSRSQASPCRSPAPSAPGMSSDRASRSEREVGLAERVAQPSRGSCGSWCHRS